MNYKRKAWETIAKLIGKSGTVRIGAKQIECKIKEIVILNEKIPVLIIVDEFNNRYPLSRFKPNFNTQSINKNDSKNIQNTKQTQSILKAIKDGKGELIRTTARYSIYKISSKDTLNPKIVTYDRITHRIKIL